MRLDKVLLISPPISPGQVYGRYAPASPMFPPLGLCCIGGALLQDGCEVRLMDCTAERSSFADIRRQITDFQPHMVGLTSTTVSFHSAQQVLALVKGLDPSILTVLGGAHVSAVPVQTLEECPHLDVGVCGEGETTIRELRKAVRDERALSSVPGICCREQGGVVLAAPRHRAADLDQFPPPARHLLKDLKAYFPNPFRGGPQAVSMISSRGCALGCSYCDQSVFGRSWRGHSVDHVMRELRELKKSFRFDFFSFEDDHFLINPRRVQELCERMIAERMDIGWSCSARVDSIVPELLSLMKRAGCRTIYFGIETGSPRMARLIDKGLDLDQVRHGVRLCADSGIKAYGSFMLGIPTETPEEMDQTMGFALSLPLEAISCFLYVPYPGTPLRALALASGFVSQDWRDYSAHPTRPPFVGFGLSAEDLLSRQRRFYRGFYLRPGYVARHWRRWLNPGFLGFAAALDSASRNR